MCPPEAIADKVYRSSWLPGLLIYLFLHTPELKSILMTGDSSECCLPFKPLFKESSLTYMRTHKGKKVASLLQ